MIFHYTAIATALRLVGLALGIIVDFVFHRDFSFRAVNASGAIRLR